MRLLRITTLYQSYLDEFYRRNPALAQAAYAVQRAALDYDAFGWADFWNVALRPRGYEVLDIALNARRLQQAWASEHLGRSATNLSGAEIALAQAKAFRPDVLWLDVADESLLQRIRKEVPSVRLVLGWSGSLTTESPAWRLVDLMLSCADEVVERFTREGLRAAQLHHGYDPRVEERLEQGSKRWNVSFVGQILTGDAIHATRAQILEQVHGPAGLTIWSPDGSARPRDVLRARLREMAGTLGGALLRWGVPERGLGRVPPLARATKKRLNRGPGLSPALRAAIRPAVYGLGMYQLLRDSHATLNVHADSSPRFASNMRLFEAPGIGTCLVTDWKENLAELFDLDREIVTYKSVGELTEKLRWLAQAPAERQAIADAGRRRAMREHTYAHRAERLDTLIRGAIR